MDVTAQLKLLNTLHVSQKNRTAEINMTGLQQ